MRLCRLCFRLCRRLAPPRDEDDSVRRTSRGGGRRTSPGALNSRRPPPLLRLLRPPLRRPRPLPNNLFATLFTADPAIALPTLFPNSFNSFGANFFPSTASPFAAAPAMSSLYV